MTSIAKRHGLLDIVAELERLEAACKLVGVDYDAMLSEAVAEVRVTGKQLYPVLEQLWRREIGALKER